jgi:large subunit ribosomal protein L5
MSEKDKDKKDKEKKPKGAHPGAAQGKPGDKGQKKAKKPKVAEAEQEAGGPEEPQQPAPPARLMQAFKEKIVPELQQQLGYKNQFAVPRLEKIVISMGLGKAVTDGEKGKIEQAEKELAVIAGQRPVRCKAKKSVANFKVREGMETGLKVTLRGNRMYEFLDRLITLAIPRVKDFRGLNPTGFDKSGNFNFGFTEQTVFPEVDAAAITFQQGMNITMVTTARSPKEGRELLKMFGMPFREEGKQEK